MSAEPKVSRWSNRAAISMRWIAAVVLVLLGVTSLSHAQVLYGSITGTVSDTTGAIVPNVTVNITNQQTGEVRTTAANQTGT